MFLIHIFPLAQEPANTDCIRYHSIIYHVCLYCARFPGNICHAFFHHKLLTHLVFPSHLASLPQDYATCLICECWIRIQQTFSVSPSLVIKQACGRVHPQRWLPSNWVLDLPTNLPVTARSGQLFEISFKISTWVPWFIFPYNNKYRQAHPEKEQ